MKVVYLRLDKNQEILIKSKMKKVILVNFDFQGLYLSLPLL